MIGRLLFLGLLLLLPAPTAGEAIQEDDLLTRCRAARSDLSRLRPERLLMLFTSWRFDPEPGQRVLEYRATRLQAMDGRFYLAVAGVETPHRFRYAVDSEEDALAESMVSGELSREGIEPISARALSDQTIALQLLFTFPWVPEGTEIERIEGKEDEFRVSRGERRFEIRIQRPEHLPVSIRIPSGRLRGEVLEWGRLEDHPQRARVPSHWRFVDERFGQAWEERLEGGQFDMVTKTERFAELFEARAIEGITKGPRWEVAPLPGSLSVLDSVPLSLQGAWDLARRAQGARENTFYRVAYQRGRLEVLGDTGSIRAYEAGTSLELTTVHNPRFLGFEIRRRLLESPREEWLFRPRLGEPKPSGTPLVLQVGRALVDR